jgi:signal transduction histidine kinase/phage shock protein PspC (stress-responsive transcriptional regulator)
LPLRRPRRGRVLGGVCAGLAAHLGQPVGIVRLVMVFATLVGGAGAVLYVWLWITVPAGDPVGAALDQRAVAMSRLAPRLRTGAADLPVAEIAVGLVLVIGAGLMIAQRQGHSLDANWLLPALLLLAGVALAWSQLDAVQREQWLMRTGGGTPVSILRLVGGVLLVLVGVLLLVWQDAPPASLLRSAAATLAVLIGVALALAPWWLRLVRELGDVRAAREREAERADIAAHLHDSVLQTLALIRAQSSDPEAVARLARAQERELRGWLYEDRAAPGTSIAQAVRGVVGDVEDAAAEPIEAVVVGDRAPDANTDAMLQATREALLNAVRHGAAPISLYVEVRPEAVEVFVRDHGQGFDLAAVPADRLGVRESIIGRVRRRGGTATVQNSGERGTEVHLALPAAGGEVG